MCEGGEDGLSDGHDSWTVSKDMLMIDEVHTSEESENLSSVHSQAHEAANIKESSFFNIGAISAKEKSKSNEQSSESEDWTKVTRKRKHIELKDLTEDDFLSLIEAKN